MADLFCDEHARPKINTPIGRRCPTCSSGQEMDIGEVMKILKNPRRRMLVMHLMQHESISVDEASTKIAAAEYGKDIDEITSQERKRVYISLYQTHVEGMAESGVVDYVRKTGTVGRGERFWEVADYIGAIQLVESSIIGIAKYRLKKKIKRAIGPVLSTIPVSIERKN